MTVESATTINQLNASNPSGSDAKSEGDDHLRLLKSTLLTTFPGITGSVTATHTQLNKLASTFSVASASSNAVAVDSSGRVGIGASPSYQLEVSAGGSSGAVVDVVRIFGNAGSTASARALFGTTANGVNAGILGAAVSATGGAMALQTAQSGTGTLTTRMTLDENGNVIKTLTASAPSLSVNQTMVMSLVSDTQLKISVRGSDGTTRTATIALS